jgi:hypothetical protein
VILLDRKFDSISIIDLDVSATIAPWQPSWLCASRACLAELAMLITLVLIL